MQQQSIMERTPTEATAMIMIVALCMVCDFGVYMCVVCGVWEMCVVCGICMWCVFFVCSRLETDGNVLKWKMRFGK